jgi:4-amino-4-deoxy-L-arabinose transferase-like glycosyltransferase
MGRYRVCAAGIVVLAAVLRFWALDAGLPHPLTRPDEEVVLEMTLRVAKGVPLGWGIYSPAYIHAVWAWNATGLEVAQALGLAPPGPYAAVARAQPAAVLPVARALSALAGTLAVAALMMVVRRELGTTAALVAGVLLATNFLHARDSHAVKPDALLSLEVVLGLWAMLPLARAASVRTALLPGLVLGVAVATKYPGVLLAAPLYAAAVMGSRGASWWRRLVPLPAVAAGAVGALVFVATSPTVVTDPATRSTVVFLVQTLLPTGMPGSIVARAPAVVAREAGGPDSPYVGPWWKGLVYHATFSLRYGAGLLPTVLLPLALVWGFAGRRPLLFLAAVFAVAYYVVVGLSPVNLARYMTPMLPTLALLEGAMLVAAARALATWGRPGEAVESAPPGAGVAT